MKRIKMEIIPCLLDTKGESLTTALARKYPSSILFSGIATWGGSWKDFEVNDMNTLRYGNLQLFLLLNPPITARSTLRRSAALMHS